MAWYGGAYSFFCAGVVLSGKLVLSGEKILCERRAERLLRAGNILPARPGCASALPFVRLPQQNFPAFSVGYQKGSSPKAQAYSRQTTRLLCCQIQARVMIRGTQCSSWLCSCVLPNFQLMASGFQPARAASVRARALALIMG